MTILPDGWSSATGNDYNYHRHSSLGYQPPARHAATYTHR